MECVHWRDDCWDFSIMRLYSFLLFGNWMWIGSGFGKGGIFFR